MYRRISKDFYWPTLALENYEIVKGCPHCSRNRIKLGQNLGKLQLSQATAPLTSVCIDIFGECIRTRWKNEILLIITDRYTTLTKRVPVKGNSAAEVAKNFMNWWVFNYDPPQELIADNGGCFT